MPANNGKGAAPVARAGEAAAYAGRGWGVKVGPWQRGPCAVQASRSMQSWRSVMAAFQAWYTRYSVRPSGPSACEWWPGPRTWPGT